MKGYFTKSNKEHRYKILFCVKHGELAEGFRSPQFYPSDYIPLVIKAKRGKVFAVETMGKTNLPTAAGEYVDIPEWVLKDPIVQKHLKKIDINCNEIQKVVPHNGGIFPHMEISISSALISTIVFDLRPWLAGSNLRQFHIASKPYKGKVIDDVFIFDKEYSELSLKYIAGILRLSNVKKYRFTDAGDLHEMIVTVTSDNE